MSDDEAKSAPTTDEMWIEFVYEYAWTYALLCAVLISILLAVSLQVSPGPAIAIGIASGGTLWGVVKWFDSQREPAPPVPIRWTAIAGRLLIIVAIMATFLVFVAVEKRSQGG